MRSWQKIDIYSILSCMDELRGAPIKVVVRRTGLSAHVLRVWERRYSAVTPNRTETNRRLYTEADIQRLEAMQRAIVAGHSIGRIAGLSTEDIVELAGPEPATEPWASESAAASAPRLGPEAPRPADEHVEACLAAVLSLDAAALEAELARAAVELGRAPLVERIIEPLMGRLDQLWSDGSRRIADEHLASAVVKTFLGGLWSSLRLPESAPRILVTTPAGQVHEIGAMLFATVAGFEGWRVIYLGPNLPAEEIAGAAHHRDVRAIALSIVYPSDDPHLGAELISLRQYLDDSVAILCGGRGACAYTAALAEIGASVAGSLGEARRQLAELRQVPST